MHDNDQPEDFTVADPRDWDPDDSGRNALADLRALIVTARERNALLRAHAALGREADEVCDALEAGRPLCFDGWEPEGGVEGYLDDLAARLTKAITEGG
ncbi:MAG: hypothetical protein M3083_22245 [Actinomycetota bacterium]|nr:hypothetical protein [Actinomycetota bacterium]